MTTPSIQTHTPTTRPFARRLGTLDRLLSEVDRALTVLSGAATAGRPYPGRTGAANRPAVEPTPLAESERKQSAGLMRVNHVGEVCAQALYRGQAIVCKDERTRALLLHAAAEEVDHLAWCNRRLDELNSRPSALNPLWYAGSFTLGLVAGYAGVPRNLGFMAETERQVEQHLDSHLKIMAPHDEASRRVIEQMKADEVQHRTTAEQAGAIPLPFAVKRLMRAMSKVMTTTAYHV